MSQKRSPERQATLTFTAKVVSPSEIPLLLPESPGLAAAHPSPMPPNPWQMGAIELPKMGLASKTHANIANSICNMQPETPRASKLQWLGPKFYRHSNGQVHLKRPT